MIHVVEGPAGDWPPRWELTAPESHVISYRGGGFMGEPVRLAVTELIVRRVLALERVERTGRWRREQSWALIDGPAAMSGVESPLTVVLELARSEPRQTLPVLREGSTMAVPVDGVLVRDLKRAVRKRWGNGDGYRAQHVAPVLVERGLLKPIRERRRSGEAEFDWTEAGREADEQLTRWLELGREHLAEWVRTDRARAHAFTRGAGSAVLLMRDQFPVLEDLSHHAGAAAAGIGGLEGTAGGDPTLGDPSLGDPSLGDPSLGHGALGHSGAGLDLGGLGHGLGLDFGGLLDLGGGLGDIGGGGGDGGGGGGG
jgi:hypothetical protein